MRDMECTRFDIEKMRIRPGEIPNFGSGRLRYRLLEAPTLRDDEGYYESLSIIIRNSDRVPLAVRKVRYVRSLNLPIWETGIKFKQDGEPDPIQEPPDLLRNIHVEYICPLPRRSLSHMPHRREEIMDEIPGLHSFLGRNRRIDILDLLLPLGEVPFQLGHLLVARPDLSRDQCVRILDTLVAEGLIKASFPGAKPEGRWYSLCTDQKRIWAMNNLVHSIFEDGRRRASMRAMGMKIPCPGEKS